MASVYSKAAHDLQLHIQKYIDNEGIYKFLQQVENAVDGANMKGFDLGRLEALANRVHKALIARINKDI